VESFRNHGKRFAEPLCLTPPGLSSCRGLLHLPPRDFRLDRQRIDRIERQFIFVRSPLARTPMVPRG
jgi:hypothetical protein